MLHFQKFIYSFLIIFIWVNLSAQTKMRIEDERDEKIYNYSEVGTQTWLSENMNFTGVPACWCYEGVERECEKNGRFYTYESAKQVCPNGWRLPEKADFETLIANSGGYSAGLLSTLAQTGQNAFNLQYAGNRNADGTYKGKGNIAGYWIKGELKKKKVNVIVFNKTKGTTEIIKIKKTDGFYSVRCIKK
jgi:uncharacterized protein (TIGR02145 family)